MKVVVGNSTTRNMNSSDIFESGALFFRGKDKPTKHTNSSQNVLYHQMNFHQLSRRSSIIRYRRTSS